MGIESWSTTPGSNTSAPPNGAPEGMAPSAVNDTMRQQMADHRSQWNDAQWFQYGDGDGASTITYVAANQFKVEGADVTAHYHVGRRVKVSGTTTGTVYGTITAVSFSTDTTVTVQFDSGSLSNESLTVWTSILRADQNTQPAYVWAAPNLIVNPEFRYDQEGFSGTTDVGGGGDYLCDQWEFRWNGSIGARWTVSIEANGGLSRTRKWLKLLCTTAAASPTTNEFQYVHQQLEAQAIRASLLDVSQKVGAMRLSMDMIVHADAGSSITFPCNVGVFVWTQDGTARQFVENVTIDSADTWQRVVLEVDADTVGTISDDNGSGLWVGFNLVAGSGRATTGGAWENSDNDTHQSGAANLADATNNYVGITAVKLEPGTVATPFVSEGYDEGLARCLRYYFQIQEESTNAAGIAMAVVTGSTTALALLHLPVPMRAKAKSVSVSNGSHFSLNVGNFTRAVSAVTSNYQGTFETCTVALTVASTTAGEAGLFRTDGSSSGFIAVSTRF